MNNYEKIGICYLCGEELIGEINRDHIPPLQVFGKDIRKEENLSNLITLRVHKECNEAFHMDEEYVIYNFSILSAGDKYSDAVVHDIFNRYHEKEKGQKLLSKIKLEMFPNPKYLVLPNGKMYKKMDFQRIKRVLIKINKGLCFIHYKKFIPDKNFLFVHYWYSFPGNEEVPDELKTIVSVLASQGKYPDIFDYKIYNFKHIYIFANLFYNRIVSLCIFFEKKCKCEECAEIINQLTHTTANKK